MPNLPHQVPPTAEDLRSYLERVVRGSRVTKAIIKAEYQPLVLLETSHMMAAFAFSNGDMRKTYDELYGSFKNYYSEREGQWNDRELAFVFCVAPDSPQLERFSSNVETNVYFCRKYVITLGSRLEASLARLPFLPLAPLGGRPFRPASAQTFLRQCGVPATLAKNLVVPQQRSAQGIVKDCLSETFGEPHTLTPAANTNVPEIEADAATNPVYLNTVEIKNFRAYRKTQTFTMGADVTVLHGPNGFGKTSFFDAIDFAVTGGIGRIRSANETQFKKIARHLDSTEEESSVSLSLLRHGAAHNIKRTVNDPKRALLDGKIFDRKAILTEVTAGNIPAADRVENFANLFRATHIFGQEQQELTRDFQDDCQLPAQVVSRMLAFEDYTNAVNKTVGVREVLEAAITRAQKDINENSEQIINERSELDRLAKVAPGGVKVDALDGEIATLRKRLEAVGISVTVDKPDLPTVRNWRASLESRRAESESRIARLSALAKDAADRQRMVEEAGILEKQISDKDVALTAVNDNRVAAELELQTAQRRLAEITSKRADAQTHADVIEWVRTAQPRYQHLLNQQREVNEELSRATAVLAQHRTSEENAAADLRAHENLSEQAGERVAAKRAELVALQTLADNAVIREANRNRLSAVVELEQQALKSLESLRGDEQELALQVAALKAEEAHLSDLIENVDRNQSQVKRLLSQLQGYVGSSICPLCGHEHHSQEELLRHIQEQVAADAASSARIELAGLRERLTQFTLQVTDNRHKQEATAAHLATLKAEQDSLIAGIADFAGSAAKLDIIIEASSPFPNEEFRARHNRVEQEIENLNKDNQEAASRLTEARVAVAETKKLVAEANAEFTNRTVSLNRLQEEVNQIRNDPRSASISLDIEPERLAELQQISLTNLNGMNTDRAKAEADVALQGPQVRALNQESGSVRREQAGLRSKVADIQREMTQIDARLREARLPIDSSEDSIHGLIAEESLAQAGLVTLRDSVSNLELVIDAATTAAALTSLKQSVRDKEKAVDNATLSRDQNKSWLAYFEQVSRLLVSEQNEAVANFTREYGPRTSVIQQRLRSVYGFDEIEVQAQESAITVRVKRRGEELRPTDYFSQSQQQTLLLGLFLTACISQTWSSLSPVFLDDPVTHFDDLNTYAFLDLILGLIESDVGKRQFVISTCDEKLLQLARYKFRHLGERAKFYGFSAIGADGPVVDELTLP